MTEEEIRLEAEKKAAEESAKKEAEEKAKELKSKSAEELAELLSQTRSEAKERRLKERELEAEIKKMKDEQKAAIEAKLIEDGKTQELLDAKILELTDTQTKLEKANRDAEESKKFKAAKVEEFKKRMGSKWQDEYSSLSLIALDTLANSIVPKKVGTDLGASGETPEIELTADQKKEAREKYPYSTEEKAYEFYKHNLIKIGEIKEK